MTWWETPLNVFWQNSVHCLMQPGGTVPGSDLSQQYLRMTYLSVLARTAVKFTRL
jgi:hypothetical protein